MSNKNGIKVFAPFVAPEGTPVAYASDIAGCNRVVATKADLLTIPTSLLEVGMSVFVQDEAKDYRLANKSEVPVASDWTSAAPTAADIKVAEDKTLADVLITKEEVATKIADATNAAGETYQTKADALAAKTALEESIHAVSTAGLSEETKQDIQAAKDAAATLAGFQQTLDQTKTELTQKVEEAKQAALTQEDKTAIASIADVKSTAEAAKAKAEELEPKVTANKESLDTLKTKVDALPDSAAVDAKITTAKEAINNSIDLVKDSVAALKTVVQGSEDGATKGLDAKITEAKEEAASNLAAAKQALEHSIEQAATAGLPEETKQDIQAAKEAATKLTEITSKVNDAVSKATDADTKVGTLETKVTALESFKTDAEPKLAAVDTVKEAVDTLKDTTVPAIDARVTTLEGKAAPTDFTEDQKTKLDEILTRKHFATADDISNANDELKGELATQESVTQLTNQAVTTAEGKITKAKTELEGKIDKAQNGVSDLLFDKYIKSIHVVGPDKTTDGEKNLFVKVTDAYKAIYKKYNLSWGCLSAIINGNYYPLTAESSDSMDNYRITINSNLQAHVTFPTAELKLQVGPNRDTDFVVKTYTISPEDTITQEEFNKLSTTVTKKEYSYNNGIVNRAFIKELLCYGDRGSKYISFSLNTPNSDIVDDTLKLVSGTNSIKCTNTGETSDFGTGYFVGLNDSIDITAMSITYTDKKLGDIVIDLEPKKESDFAETLEGRLDCFLAIFEKSDLDSEESIKQYIRPVKLDKDTGDYTFIVPLKAATGTQTNICVAFATSYIAAPSNGGNCKEFNNLPKAVSINGQFGQFKDTSESNNFYAYLTPESTNKLRSLACSTANQFAYYELKNPLTPDGQNDTYIVTYHRPFNI